MNDKEVTAGLALLADEAETPQIDTYAVIAAAKTRTRNRRLTTASALGIVAVAGVMVATMGFGGAEQLRPATDPPPATSQTVPGFQPYDDQSRKLTGELAEVIDGLIPAQFTVEEPVRGAEVDPLTFVANESYVNTERIVSHYSAYADISDAQGLAVLQIAVAKRPAGSPLEPVAGWPVVPCAEGMSNCVRRELDDGTVAAAQLNVQSSGLGVVNAVTAQRPDGTYIQVISYLPDGPVVQGKQLRPQPPLTIEELFKFATVFTY